MTATNSRPATRATGRTPGQTAGPPGGWPGWEPGDHRLAVAADGLLGGFNAAGVLVAADVHVARALGRLGGEDRSEVLLAAALAVRALRTGSVCIDLGQLAGAVADDTEQLVDASSLAWPEPAGWLAACRDSPLVAGPELPGGRPLRLDHDLLYLDRYWCDEQQVAADLAARARLVPAVDIDRLRDSLSRYFEGDGADLQRLAAAMSTLRAATVLAGGPGTGKTFTVARLLAVLYDQPDPPRRVLLAAPTGKAAARLKEAVRAETAKLRAKGARLPDLDAATLHRTLGWRPTRGRFAHNRDNRLPADVVVVDETSMVPLTMMARLLEALRPEARLVLVGDPFQLASVEAGAVLGDVVRAAGPEEPDLLDRLRVTVPADDLAAGGQLRNGVVTLRTRHRFAGVIAELADAVQAGDADEAIRLLRSADPAVQFIELDVAEASPAAAELRVVYDDLVQTAAQMAVAAERGDGAGALALLQRHRLLCGHRRGPYGAGRWATEIRARLGVDERAEHFAGRPVIVTTNDYDLNLFNGDTGVVVVDPAGGGLRVAFETGTVATARIGDVDSVYAMTVHRAQGSQFDRVSVVLPPAESPIATRELLYTAITRATTLVRVIGTEDAVRAAVARPVSRASGLRSLVPD